MTARARTLVSAVQALAVAGLVSGCAGRAESRAWLVGPVSQVKPTLPAFGLAPMTSSNSVEAAELFPCRAQVSAFSVGFVAGFRGKPDPVEAARWFERHNAVPGFGTPASVWVLTYPGQNGRDEATLVDGTVSLHAARFADGTWAIDGGERCG